MDDIRTLLAQHKSDGVSSRTKSEIKKNDDFAAGVGPQFAAPAASAPAPGDQSKFTAGGSQPPLSAAARMRQAELLRKMKAGQ